MIKALNGFPDDKNVISTSAMALIKAARVVRRSQPKVRRGRKGGGQNALPAGQKERSSIRQHMPGIGQ
jgi:hypothetical protein